jgi:hypothetical protein
MVRLAIVLRHISEKSRTLAESIHEKLHEGGQDSSLWNLDRDLRDIRRLRLHAKELQTLVARAAISRYKDHGELMRCILSEMKLDKMTDLLDQQLRHLAELYADVLREIEERRREKDERQREEARLVEERRREEDEEREAEARLAIEILAAIVAFSALHDFADSVFMVLKPVEGTHKRAEGAVTLILMGICIAILISIFRKWRRKQTEGNDVLDKPKHEQKKSSEQRVTAESRSRYFVALLFASIFIASTTTLLIIYRSFITGDVNRVPLSSDVIIWVTVFTAIVSAIGTSSTIILAWRNDKRDAREKELKIAQLERELAASSEKPALPISEENHK